MTPQPPDPSTAQETRVDPIQEHQRMWEAEIAVYRSALWNLAGSIVAACDSGNENLARLACMETSPLVDLAREDIARFGLSNADTGDRITSDNQNAVDRPSEGNLASRSAAPQVEQEKP